MRTPLSAADASALASVTARRDAAADAAAVARDQWATELARLRAQGATLPALAAATGLSHQRVHQVIARAQA